LKIEIEIPNYDPSKGLQTEWDTNFFLKTDMQHGDFVISADSEALKEIAIILLTLAQKDVPNGTHIHFDTWNYPMKIGSISFVIEKSINI